MTLSIDDFKSKLTGGGARPTHFRVIVNYPTFANGDSELTSFMVKGASLPGAVIGELIVPFRGRQLKVAGDRTFEPMTLTVINDVTMDVRNAIERWMNQINGHKSNISIGNPSDYKADVLIQQLDREDSVVKTYTLRGAFPTNLSEIELSNDSNDTIEEFTVELIYDRWDSDTTN